MKQQENNGKQIFSTVNQRVVGSSPTGGAKASEKSAAFLLVFFI
jgi:hypothetical protein